MSEIWSKPNPYTTGGQGRLLNVIIVVDWTSICQKQPLVRSGQIAALFKVFRCGPECRFSFLRDGGPRWET